MIKQLRHGIDGGDEIRFQIKEPNRGVVGAEQSRAEVKPSCDINTCPYDFVR